MLSPEMVFSAIRSAAGSPPLHIGVRDSTNDRPQGRPPQLLRRRIPCVRLSPSGRERTQQITDPMPTSVAAIATSEDSNAAAVNALAMLNRMPRRPSLRQMRPFSRWKNRSVDCGDLASRPKPASTTPITEIAITLNIANPVPIRDWKLHFTRRGGYGSFPGQMPPV